MLATINRSITGLLLYVILIVILEGCKKMEYSPYQTDEDDFPSELNNRNLIKLKSTEIYSDDTVTVIYCGDSQRYYDRLVDLVAKANTIPNVDMLIISGDIADFGIIKEYSWIYERLEKLNTPYFAVVGNHDLASNSGEVFTRMFGLKNASFNYKGYKFLLHDTNGREYNFDGTAPNMWWLTDQLNDSTAKWFVGLSHVPPYDKDFDKSLESPYKNLFASKKNFIVSLHGHQHEVSDSYYYGDGVRYMTSNSVKKEEFVLLKFIHGNIIKQMIAY